MNIIATAGYMGRIPFAPGTFGSLAGILFFYFTSGLAPAWQMVTLLCLIVLAVVSAHKAEEIMGETDPGAIVIDEVAGMAVTCMGLPFSLPVAVCAFILFRLFDILKPFPINWLEQRFSGGLGVVIDDVFAGLICRIILGILV
ncbi:MAG: phosphatidylglycerophosphatase A [Deltaproteobacteria bacterium]|nr:phosphatidylglycerophosphatase A [Deltaproteobacteria bacterium]